MKESGSAKDARGGDLSTQTRIDIGGLKVWRRNSVPTVLHCTEWPADVGKIVSQHLEAIAEAAPDGLARLCLHPSSETALHAMLIAAREGTHYPPHKHLDKTEVYVPVEGTAQLIRYNDLGAVAATSDLVSGYCLAASTCADQWHSLKVTSAFFIFWEFTTGPFRNDGSLTAPWIDASRNA